MNSPIRKSETRNVIWLASYPKSGNTWFRIFLSNLLSDKAAEMNINALYSTPIASCRKMFEESLGIESSCFSNDEIDLMRPDFYRNISSETAAGKKTYHKVHDAFTKNLNGEWILPPEITFCALYFLRNPLDIAVSAANHFGYTFDKAIENMNNPQFALADNSSTLPPQLRQILLGWSGHVLSWINAPVRVLVIRYEDMKFDTFATFKKAVEFIGFDKTPAEIRAAISRSSFEVLQEQETRNGFKERSHKAKLFFRKGEVGDWRNHLNPAQVKKLLDCHSEVMELFGYLKDGEPAY
ncbi:MAG: sulfotransferase domain-containing protein [Victivallaceae bacterium]|nr:sulfotransferase domain-containing protein [Victivallaceae bacterium]